MARRRKRSWKQVAKVFVRRKASGQLEGRTTIFADLPVGSCFAWSPTAKVPTRQKVSSRETKLVPGRRVMVVGDHELPVKQLPCGELGRARRRRR